MPGPTEVHPDCDELCHTERNQGTWFEAQKELRSVLNLFFPSETVRGVYFIFLQFGHVLPFPLLLFSSLFHVFLFSFSPAPCFSMFFSCFFLAFPLLSMFPFSVFLFFHFFLFLLFSPFFSFLSFSILSLGGLTVATWSQRYIQRSLCTFPLPLPLFLFPALAPH